MTRKFWLITGVHSSHWIENIKENYLRCKTPYTELVIVENGKGVNLWDKTKDLNEHIIQSKPGAANYINAGIEYVKKHCGPDDWFLKFDSDDFYGKDRVRQVNELAEHGAEACGAVSIFVKSENNDMFALDSKIEFKDKIERPHMPHGPTLGAKISSTVKFPIPPEPWGEDAYWIEDMRCSGVDFHSLPIEGFTYVRHNTGTHTFPVPDGLVRHLWFVDVYNIGEWSEKIAEGKSKPDKLDIIPYCSKSFMKACKHLKELSRKNMNIHKIKKKHLKEIKDAVDAKQELEKRIGSIQIQIVQAQSLMKSLADEHAVLSNNIQVMGDNIAESFGAESKIGRVLVNKKVFVEGVPSGTTEEEIEKAVDDYFEREKDGKSSIKNLKD